MLSFYFRQKTIRKTKSYSIPSFLSNFSSLWRPMRIYRSPFDGEETHMRSPRWHFVWTPWIARLTSGNLRKISGSNLFHLLARKNAIHATIGQKDCRIGWVQTAPRHWLHACLAIAHYSHYSKAPHLRQLPVALPSMGPAWGFPGFP